MKAGLQKQVGGYLSYLYIAISILVNIMMVPYLKQCLGDAEYGLYLGVGSIIGYMSVMDFGMGTAIVRYISQYRAQGDEKQEKNFFAMSMILYSVIAFLVLCVGVVLYLNSDMFLSAAVTEAQRAKYKVMMGVLALNMTVYMFQQPLTSMVIAHEKFVFAKASSIAKLLIRTFSLFLLLSHGFDSIAIVVLDTVLSLLLVAANAVYIFVILKVRMHLYRFEFPLVRRILTFSFFIFLDMIAGQVFWNSDQVIIGKLLSPEMITVDGIGMQLILQVLNFSTAISSMLLPQATRLVTSTQDRGKYTDFVIRFGRIQGLILGLIICGFVTQGLHFIKVWLGSEYSPMYFDSYLITAILAIMMYASFICAAGVPLVQAMNRHMFKAIAQLSTAAANIILTFWLASEYGPVGAAVGTAICLATSNLLNIIYYWKKIKLQMMRFAIETLRGILPVFLVSLALGFLIAHIPGTGWMIFLLRCVLVAAIYCLGMWFCAMNESEKKLLLAPFWAVVGKLKRKK